MEVALRQRLEGVADVSISQSRQTTQVRFAKGDHAFSPAAFRAAVDQAGVKVVSFEIDACGTIAEKADGRWLEAGRNRYRLLKADAAPAERHLCISGRLDDRSDPAAIDVTDVQVER